MTPEQERAIALAAARRRRAEAEANQADTAAVEEPVEEQGIVGRSMDALQLGLSDAMSTMAGDTYGRDGDPVQRDDISIPERLLKAAGGDILPAVGDVASDALITGGKEVLPQGAQDAISGGLTMAMESAPVQTVMGGLDQWKEAHPRSYNIAGEAANVLTAALPVKGLKPKFGARAMDKVADAEKLANQKGVLNLAIPDDLEGAKPVMRKGLGRKIEAEPGARLKAQVETTENVPGVSANKTYTENVTAVEKEIGRVNDSLVEKLGKVDPIDPINVDVEIDKALARIAETPALRGAPEGVAESITTELQRLMREAIDPDTGLISPNDILQVRRDLDSWVTDFAPTVFEEGSSALKIANREIRGALNDAVKIAAPDAGVADDLKTMNQLLDSKSTMLPRAKKEVGTGRFKRYLDAVERDTGFSHPKTPASVAANVGVVPAAFAGSVALGRQALKGAKGGVGRNVGATQRMMADAIRGGSEVGQRALALGALRDEDDIQIPYRR